MKIVLNRFSKALGVTAIFIYDGACAWQLGRGQLSSSDRDPRWGPPEYGRVDLTPVVPIVPPKKAWSFVKPELDGLKNRRMQALDKSRAGGKLRTVCFKQAQEYLASFKVG